MKKCNFFSVLLLALFMFCGFDSSAQSYKPVSQALEAVQTVVEQSEHTLSTSSTSASITANQTGAQMILRSRLGSVLLTKIKQSQDVAKSVTEMYTQYTSTNPSTNETRVALDHLKNSLLN